MFYISIHYKIGSCVKGCTTDESCPYGEECVAREAKNDNECVAYGTCPPGIYKLLLFSKI